MNKSTKLNLNNKGLTQFPEYISKKIKKLDLSNNLLTNIPENILGSLTELEELNISGNKITKLPSTIKQLKKLKVFNFSKNEILKIPKEIIYCKLIEEFNCSFNNLEKIPREIGQLKKIVKFNASYNKLTKFPNELKVIKLLEFDISMNLIEHAPAEFYRYSNKQDFINPKLISGLSNEGVFIYLFELLRSNRIELEDIKPLIKSKFKNLLLNEDKSLVVPIWFNNKYKLID